MTKGNQSAYPTTPENAVRMNGTGGTGLTKRERFAMAAMQGMISNPSMLEGMKKSGKKEADVILVYAHDSVIFADALLAELAKGNG